jgi:hypothetical protein
MPCYAELTTYAFTTKLAYANYLLWEVMGRTFKDAFHFYICQLNIKFKYLRSVICYWNNRIQHFKNSTK